MKYESAQSCIEACIECAIECENCETQSLSEENAHRLERCIVLAKECALMCRSTAARMAKGGDDAFTLCQACAEICEACAEECEKHDIDHCQYCAEECHACAEECKKMTESSMHIHS